MNTLRWLCLTLFTVALFPGQPARAGANVIGYEIDAGGFSADLTIKFEQAVGLNLSNLGISVELVDPLDPNLLARISNASTSPLSGFPVLVTIEPPSAGGLSFSGVATVELYTHDLQYLPGSPMRMYSAPLHGSFVDVTSYNASGSYRSGGTKGTFSQFLLVADLRSLDAQALDKFDRLDALLSTHAGAMPAAVHQDLVDLAAAAATAYEQDDVTAAIGYVEDFDAKLKTHSGTDIPDVWRSTRDLSNVAGELRAAAATLRFGLIEVSNSQ